MLFVWRVIPLSVGGLRRLTCAHLSYQLILGPLNKAHLLKGVLDKGSLGALGPHTDRGLMVNTHLVPVFCGGAHVGPQFSSFGTSWSDKGRFSDPTWIGFPRLL